MNILWKDKLGKDWSKEIKGSLVITFARNVFWKNNYILLSSSPRSCTGQIILIYLLYCECKVMIYAHTLLDPCIVTRFTESFCRDSRPSAEFLLCIKLDNCPRLSSRLTKLVFDSRSAEIFLGSMGYHLPEKYRFHLVGHPDSNNPA